MAKGIEQVLQRWKHKFSVSSFHSKVYVVPSLDAGDTLKLPLDEVRSSPVSDLPDKRFNDPEISNMIKTLKPSNNSVFKSCEFDEISPLQKFRMTETSDHPTNKDYSITGNAKGDQIPSDHVYRTSRGINVYRTSTGSPRQSLRDDQRPHQSLRAEMVQPERGAQNPQTQPHSFHGSSRYGNERNQQDLFRNGSDISMGRHSEQSRLLDVIQLSPDHGRTPPGENDRAEEMVSSNPQSFEKNGARDRRRSSIHYYGARNPRTSSSSGAPMRKTGSLNLPRNPHMAQRNLLEMTQESTRETRGSFGSKKFGESDMFYPSMSKLIPEGKELEFMEVITNDMYLQFFMEYLSGLGCSEGLNFRIAVNAFSHKAIKSGKYCPKQAFEIFQTYIAADAPLQIKILPSLADEIYNSVKQKNSESSIQDHQLVAVAKLYDSALKSLMSDLEFELFPMFRNSLEHERLMQFVNITKTTFKDIRDVSAISALYSEHSSRSR